MGEGVGGEGVSEANPTDTPTRKFQQGKTRYSQQVKINIPTRTKQVAAECILLEIIC